MYGLINSALQDMVIERFGEDKWREVHRTADVPEDSFLTMRRYDDDITYRLVGAAAEVLDAPAEQCLEMFGNYWVDSVAKRNFSALMDVTGNDTVSFLHNLNSLHDRITSTFLDYIPPAFRIEKQADSSDSYHVHYYSERKSLTPFVTGLLQGLARHFDDTLEIIAIEIDDSGEGTHSIFELNIR